MNRDSKIDVLVRLQTALFALGAAIDAAQLQPDQDTAIAIMDDDLTTNIRHARALVSQVFNTLNQEIGMTMIGSGELVAREP
jgi:hypothetical protein